MGRRSLSAKRSAAPTVSFPPRFPRREGETLHEWLEDASARLAGATGEDAAGYRLTAEEREHLLDLARIASHESGDRTNAPLVCYLVGLAQGRHGGDLAELVDEVVGKRV